MAGRYSKGESKIRPNVYYREENAGDIALASARNGVVAAVFKANWGPLGKIVSMTSPSEIADYFGDDSEGNSNVAMLEKIFIGGASVIKAVRVGNGGTQSSITLTDTDSADVVTLTAAYPGKRPLSVTIKDSLSVTTQRECIIYNGVRELMKYVFTKGAGEVDALVNAINSVPNSVVIATKVAAGNGMIQTANQTAFTTQGTSPNVVNADYSDAFDLLESARFNVLCVDSDSTDIHTLVRSYITRANDAGQMAMAVIGEPTSIPYDTRKANSAAMNSRDVIYALNGFRIGNTLYEGFNAAAVAAGLIAYLPSSDSITHKLIPGAVEVVGPLTNTQIIECLQSGALVFTTSSTGAVWIEQGINTLTTLSADQDEGWKKIRRTKTRYELLQRINESSEPVIGNVNNDSNGRATVIAIANGVINQMIAEGKLLAGTAYEDEANPPKGDSAWFAVEVLDLDSIEKIYFVYKFRFSE